MGRGNESSFKASGSHDQEPCPNVIKTFQRSSLEPVDRFPRNLVSSIIGLSH